MAPGKLIPLLTLLMCLGVGFASWLIYRAVKDQPVVWSTEIPVAQVSRATQETFLIFDTPKPSETATLQPTPIDFGDLPITQTAVKILEVANTVQAEVNTNRETQNALDGIAANATSTQVAVATGTAMAVSTAGARAEFDKQNAQRELDRQEAQDNLDIAFAYIWKVGGSALIILAIALSMLYAYRSSQIRANRKVVETISENFLENIQAPIVQTSTDAHSGAEHAVDITAAEYLVLQRAVVDLGGVLSRRKIVDGDYFKALRWRRIDDELIRKDINKIAFFARLPSGALTPTLEGWKWLKLTPPTPPPAQKSIENLQERQETRPNPARPATTHLETQEKTT